MIINNNIDDIVKNINNDKIICFKTDTIWGLSANPKSKKAIKNLYTFKARNVDKPFIFLISKNQNLYNLVENISTLEQKLIDTFWPGPLTIIFNAKPNLDILSHYTQKETIALRMPDNDICQKILNKLDYPIPSTSVNIEGNPALNNFEEIVSNFKQNDFCILQNNLTSNQSISSTIVKCQDDKVIVLREGSISKEQIYNCIK